MRAEIVKDILRWWNYKIVPPCDVEQDMPDPDPLTAREREWGIFTF